jgi:hypothetical protein
MLSFVRVEDSWPPCQPVSYTVALLAGGGIPFILRKQSAEDWTVVGEMYVHALMYGDAWNPTLYIPMVLV